MARFHLLPRDERFIPRFVQAAENVAAGAEVLFELMSNFSQLERAATRMEELEHVGDRLTHDISEALNRAFVTPFDREDIAQLATALDDVLDDAEEAVIRLHTYQIDRPTELAAQLSRVLLQQCQHIDRAIRLLGELHETVTLREHLVELHRLENEADELLNRARGGLYAGVKEVPELIKAIQWGDIYGILERATDRAEKVAVVLETILVKHG
jgi:predicted phosphate transport protein (TIGR00153 family)